MPHSYKRTILITGSTDGIGKQTAADLAQHPDNFVVVHGRNKEKCEQTVDEIVRESGNTDNVDYVIGDLSSLRDASRMVDEVQMRFPNLNVLLCNASVLEQRRTETRDGLELMFQVNFLSHFLLCHRFLGILEQNAPSRIIMIGSVLHSWTSLDWADMQAIKEYEKYLQFSRSKLMCHMMAFALHRRMMITGKRISVNVIELGREKKEPNNNCKSRSASVLSTSESIFSMGRTVTNLVQFIETSSFDSLSGKYLDCYGKQIRSGADATDERQQERLWTIAMEHCEKFL